MGFEFDPVDRAAFRAELVRHIQTAHPDAILVWGECDRRLVALFPDGRSRSIWEPNFYFSRGDSFPDAHLLGQAAAFLTPADGRGNVYLGCAALAYARLAQQIRASGTDQDSPIAIEDRAARARAADMTAVGLARASQHQDAERIAAAVMQADAAGVPAVLVRYELWN